MKVLLVSPRPLEPVRRGHQLRALQLVRALVELGHSATLLAPADGARDERGADGVRRVTVRESGGRTAFGVLRALAAGLPAQAGIHGGPALAGAAAALARDADLVVLQLARLGPLQPSVGAVPVVFDLIDSLALNFERRARFERAGLAALVRFEARRLLAFERRLVASSRGAWLVTDRDRAWLAERLPAAEAGKLATLPLAVEPLAAAALGRPAGATPRAPQAMITGNLGYFPTRQGACAFLAAAWPQVAARRPGLELVLAGARPPGSLRRAAARAGARLIADPPDLPALLRAADLALVPLEAGSGVPIKMLEAWSAGVPVVATSWAAAGADGRAGVDHLAADTSEAWADAVDRLLGRPAEALALAAAGRARLAERWSRERLSAALAAALTAL